ncbi:universal stress protein [Kitasatospora sp. NPDC093679]|uniref:universal stress protein n=1 Tax=Kitasatospora sp. NPDC093679 TaxID=3154983 RepID=UPI003430F5B8
MTRRVLTGIDGSPSSEAAAHWAAGEAQRRGAPLRLLHAWPWLSPEDTEAPGDFRPGDLRPAALRALADIAASIRRNHPGLVIETAVIGDDPVDALVKAAEGRELLVLGSRGLGGFAGLLTGSVALAVAARVNAPTVLVRADRLASPHNGTTPRGEVVVGVDPRQPADPVIDFAFAEAARRGARLRAVHGWDPVPLWAATSWVPPRSEIAAREAAVKRSLTESLATSRAAHPNVPVVVEVRRGSAAHAVVTAAEGADLVIVGRRDRRHPLGIRLGPVTHAVLHHAAAPVAVIPHN